MIIVEDGTGIPTANSYAHVYELQDYAEARGITLPSDDAALEALLHKGMDYLRAIGGVSRGRKILDTQALDFPRSVLDGHTWREVGVPAEIKEAQLVAAIAALNGELLGGVRPSPTTFATRKTVGPITVEYEQGQASPVSYLPMVSALLRTWRAGGQPPVVRG